MDTISILFIVAMALVALSLLAAVVGFIYTQIKAPLRWRLLSLVLVLIFSSWACFKLSRQIAYSDMQEAYARRLQFFVIGLDGLAEAGRTNEIHQACKTFMTYPTLSMSEEDVSNFNRLAFDTYGKSTESETTSTTNRP